MFAITHIPKGAYLFEPDDDRLLSVKKQDLEKLENEGKLDPALLKLYQDFCVLQGDRYECPASLNRLTISWYLNNAKNANVAADPNLRFYAVRDINAGEELTTDYSTYSENELAEEEEGTTGSTKSGHDH